MRVIDDPLSCIAGAIETIAGWSCVYILTWFLGIYIGMCISYGELGTNLWALLMTPLMLLVSIFENPYFIFTFLGFFGFWALPLYFDSSRARVTLLVLAMGAAIFSGYELTTVEFM